MRMSSRAVSWMLGLFAAALLVIGLLAVTGMAGMSETTLGSYNGMHIAGLVLAIVATLALAVSFGRRRRTKI